MPSPFARNPNFPVKPSVNTRKDNRRWVVIDDLPKETEADRQKGAVMCERRQLFQSMKKNSPVLLDLVTDSLAALMRENFNAKVSIPEQRFNELMEMKNVS